MQQKLILKLSFHRTENGRECNTAVFLMQVQISAESCKFTKCLKSRREEEGSEFELECAVESEDGEVTWYFNDIEITPTNNPNFHNFEFISDGKKRFDLINMMNKQSCSFN